MPRRPAFTLIELLVVIAIIGILATLVIVQTGDSNRKARNATAQSDIAQMGKAVESFRIDDLASGQVVSDLPGTTDQQGGGQSTLASVFTGTQNIAALTYAAAVSKTPGPPYVYRYVASGTPTVASGATARQLVKGSPGQPVYSLCTTLVGAVTPYFCASDSGGGGQSTLDQVAASQGAGNISAAAANGLMAWYKLDGTGTSGTATDSSGNGNDGTLTNFSFDGTTNGWTAGKIGGGLQFNGSNDYVDLPGSLSLNDTQSYTVTAWINVASDQQAETIITNQGGDTNTKVFLMYNGINIDHKLQNWYAAVSGVTSATVIPNNSWHLMSFTYQASGAATGTQTIYTDGGNPISRVGNVNNWIGHFRLGMTLVNNFPFHGVIDDVRIYSRTLSPTEVQQLYQGTL